MSRQLSYNKVFFLLSLQWIRRYPYRLRRQARHLSNDLRHNPTVSFITAAVITSKRPAVCSPVVSANHPNSTGRSCMDYSAERTYLRRPTTAGATARPAQVSVIQVVATSPERPTSSMASSVSVPFRFVFNQQTARLMTHFGLPYRRFHATQFCLFRSKFKDYE